MGWVDIRDTAETAGVLAGNYFFPGSSLITSKLVSDGSQEQLNSDAGKLAQLGSGGAGGFEGNLANWTGGEAGISGLDLGGPGSSPASWMGGGEAIDPTAVSGIDLGGPGSSPTNTGGTDWAGKAQDWAKRKAIEKTVESAFGGNKQQAASSSEDSTEQAKVSDASDKNSRRQALMEKAQSLRQRIYELRAQVAREQTMPSTPTGTN